MPVFTLVIVVHLMGLIMIQSVFGHEKGEPDTYREEIQQLKNKQAIMQGELEQIKILLNKRGFEKLPHTTDLRMDISQEPFKGKPEAALTLIEFTDYQCPFCQKYAKQTFPMLDKEYIETGKIKYVVRDFPLQSLHREAFQAAVAADCASEQGHYWEMHDRLLDKNFSPSYSDWAQHGKAIGLDETKFLNCMKSDEPGMGIRKDIEEGRMAGVRGTPTFFLGTFNKDDNNIQVLKVLRGAQSYSQMKHSLDSFLEQK